MNPKEIYAVLTRVRDWNQLLLLDDRDYVRNDLLAHTTFQVKANSLIQRLN